MDGAKLVYVDESGFSKCYYREYGFAPAGEKVHAKISGTRYARMNIIAAKRGKDILAPMLYDGTTKIPFFNDWIENRLIPETDENDVIIMDNAAFHSKAAMRDISERCRRRIIFLPPYSPDKNPIEKTWANAKRYVRTHIHKFDSLEACIKFYFQVN